MERLTASETELLTRMLKSHAYREKLAAQRFEGAIGLAPTGETEKYLLHVAEEEWEHYHKCVKVAKELGIDLEPLVDARMLVPPPGIPPFNHWLDVLLAHAFNDQAGYFVLAGLTNSKVMPYAELAAEIIAEEKMHGRYGATLLQEYYGTMHCDEAAKSTMLITHLDAAVRCLGQPNTSGERLAVSTGLKTKLSEEIIREFCAYADDVLQRIQRQDLMPISCRYLR